MVEEEDKDGGEGDGESESDEEDDNCSRHIFVATLCLAIRTSAFSGHNVTEDSHYFS